MEGYDEYSDDLNEWASGISPARLMALVDGVFAIAMTILVLEISAGIGDGEELPLLRDMWSEFYIYFLSFFILGVYWIVHHYMFHFIVRSNGILVWLNILFLSLAALIPFVTKINRLEWGDPRPQVFYGGLMVITIAVLMVLWYYATSDYRLIRKTTPKEIIFKMNMLLSIGMLLLGIGMALSYINLWLGGTFYSTALTMFIVVTARGKSATNKRKHIRSA
jgi:uncharacterized membrane protein